MFEKIILRSSDKGAPITVGEIAEALLFYQNVHFVLDWSSLNNIVKTLGMQRFLSLLSLKNISAVYLEESLGTRTEAIGTVKKHAFVGIKFAGNKEIGQIHTRKKVLEALLLKNGYRKKTAKNLVDRFRRHVPIKKINDNYFIEGGVLKAAQKDLINSDYVLEVIKSILLNIFGIKDISDKLRFNVYLKDSYFFIDTNLDFKKINEACKSLSTKVGEVTEASLVNNILMAKMDTLLAARYGGEFYTSNLRSEIIKIKHAELLNRIGIDKQELKEFTEIVIPDSPSIRDVMNNGERTFDEFLHLLEKSQKFREWAQGINPDEKLVRSYFKDITSEGWVNKLPLKLTRYVLGSTIGMIEPLFGLSASAADMFLINKILGGWKPNHFIEKQLKPFIGEY